MWMSIRGEGKGNIRYYAQKMPVYCENNRSTKKLTSLWSRHVVWSRSLVIVLWLACTVYGHGRRGLLWPRSDGGRLVRG